MAPSAGQGGRDSRDFATLSANVESLKTEVAKLGEHLSRQDKTMEKLGEAQLELSQSNKMLLTAISGTVEDPEKGISWKLRELTRWMEASKGNQKWIVRTAVGALITGIGLSAGAILLAYLHLPGAK